MTTTNTKYPVLPLRDIVVFPHMIVPLFVGREKSIKALEDVMNDDKQILLTTQKDAANDEPGKEDVYQIGTIGTVLQLLKLPDGTVLVLLGFMINTQRIPLYINIRIKLKQKIWAYGVPKILLHLGCGANKNELKYFVYANFSNQTFVQITYKHSDQVVGKRTN